MWQEVCNRVGEMLGAQRTQPDDTWRDLVGTRERALRDRTRALPYRLGITWRPDGQWGEYVTFDVLRDLPSYMADALPRRPGARALARYRRAHHCAGFYGLLVDRVVDGQVLEDAALRGDRRWVRDAWTDALHDACGSRARARSLIGDAMARWGDAVEREDRAMREGTLTPEAYGAVTRAKVSYLWVASEAMLRDEGVDEARRGALRGEFERLMLALQCNDDAMDEEEDRARWGRSVPEALGVTAGVMAATATAITRASESACARVDLARLAHERVQAVRRAIFPEIAPLDALRSVYLALAISRDGSA